MKKGFTLAEVLITLGIIGIVAALTIPAVMKNYKNRVYVSQLQKVYSQISDAAKSVMNDEQSSNFYTTTAGAIHSCSDPNNGKCESGAGYFLNNYFKTVKKNCGIFGTANANSCVVQQYKSIDGRNAGSIGGDYCIQTSNGAAICMNLTRRAADPNNPLTAYLNFDVNGPAEPNITGRDVFMVEIRPDGTVVDFDTNENNCSNPNSGGCITKIINAGWKMEY